MRPATRVENLPTGRPVHLAYLRVSSEEQAAGHGPARQRDLNQSWFARAGLAIDGVFEDIGYSAFSGEHLRSGQLGRIVAAIEDGRIGLGSTIAMENLDRLSRQSALEAIELYSRIVRRGVAIVTSADGFRYADNGTAEEKMVSVIMSLIHFTRGHSESSVKSVRVSKAWASKAEKSRDSLTPHGQRCPAWLRLSADRKSYELVPGRKAVIADIFQWTIDGLGRRAITKRLISTGVAPWSQTSAKRQRPVWNDSYISKILTGREVLGEYIPTSGGADLEPIRGYYPAAIDQATHRRAQNAMASRRGSGGRKGAMTNLLQGFCKCATCGQGMTIIDKGARSSGLKLVCRRAILGDCNNALRYDYLRAEAAVIFGLSTASDDLIAKAAKRSDEAHRERADREAELETVTSAIQRLVRRMAEIDDPALTGMLAEYRKSATSLEATIEGLSERIRATDIHSDSDGAPAATIAFYNRLDEIPEDQLPAARQKVNQQLREHISKVSFDEAGHGVIRFREGDGVSEFWQSAWKLRGNRGSFTSRLGPDGIQLRAFQAQVTIKDHPESREVHPEKSR
ncbi:hypothetical protein GCM10008171_01510 [Methylopila jiangsuensis]|uniref:Recombinase family protein n=1 Tax=Methylopila jiangsuensis TaxID=586230 RepID=A0A9W6JEP0_9HYPH|nr:recombinase family protein [Methylopila jiangsuensis]MDR6287318.1 DNA invertase Pin-like site-specific DNA recombinase [Methylopila jiangsuensis]GLK74898.1 hypothetical protein GCM10008171_01510 [Methylopila jiangsuensis]